MELYFLDKDLEFLTHPVDDVAVFSKTTAHDAVGTFSVTLARRYLQVARAAKYIYEMSSGYVGRIERVDYADTDAYGLTVAGNALDGMLMLRVINEAYAPSETNVEQVVTEAVTKFAATGDRALDRFDVCIQKGYTISEGISADPGVTLADWLYTVLPQHDLRPVVTADIDNKRFCMSLYKGVNRGGDQTAEEPVILSESFENVQNAEYGRDLSLLKNHVYAVMDDIYYGHVVIEVDNAKDGEERREAYLQTTVTSEAYYEFSEVTGESQLVPTYTLDECKARMREEAETLLSEAKESETVAGQFVESRSYIYGVDFFVGDTVSFSAPGLGITFDAKITSCTELYENGHKSLDIRIGKDISELAKLKKLVKGA